MVSGEKHPHHSTTPTWEVELPCRPRKSSDDGSLGLEIESIDISEDRSTVWSTRSGPVCLQTDNPTTDIFQLEARPICSGDRFLPPRLDYKKRICESTLVHGRSNIVTGQIPTGSNCVGDTSLESPTMEPGTSEHGNRLSEIDTRQSSSSQSVSSRDVPSTSRMAYLRERYTSEKLSEDATALMLKSWRSKTNKSYDSLFGRWSSWCSERGSDPISGPITEVLNFLADLHKQGYQYRSLNSYRSAISSVHEKIDGHGVGEHPMVSRLMKGVFNDRPPLPKYTLTWKVKSVLTYLDTLGENQKLTLTQLTWKSHVVSANTPI